MLQDRKARSIRTLDDLRTRAARRLPRFVFDFVDGGAGAEVSLERNENDLRDLTLTPRAFRVMGDSPLRTDILRQSFAAPFGIAPMGLCGLVCPGAELALSRAAESAGIAYVLSTAANASIEEVAKIAPRSSWFQLYACRDRTISRDLMLRAQNAGIRVLVLTIDGAVPGRRLRDLRNGMTLPLRIGPGMAWQTLGHLRWGVELMRTGMPRFANFEAYLDPSLGVRAAAEFFASQVHAQLDWDALAWVRDLWKGALLVKGALHAEDILRIKAAGADGVVVSNHGGRQLSCAPSPISLLPGIRQAVGGDFTIGMDSGVRSGEDIVKALAIGANFVLIGRPFLFAAAALGLRRGPAAVIDILLREMVDVIAQLGARDVKSLVNEGFRPSQRCEDRIASPKLSCVIGHLKRPKA